MNPNDTAMNPNDTAMNGEEHTGISPCWEAIDGAVVINLDRCPERWESCQAKVCTRFPAGRVHRLSAVEGRKLPGYDQAPWFQVTGERASYWAGAAGCTLSHRKAIEMAKERGWRNVFVMEDDVYIGAEPPGYSDVLRKALDELQGPYMMYLGYSKPHPFGYKVDECHDVSLWRMGGVVSTHAYIVSAPLYDWLLERLPSEDNIWEWLSRYRAIDAFYRDYVATIARFPVYTVVPQIVGQGGFGSSINLAFVPDANCVGEPRPCHSLAGLLHALAWPFRCLKILLNSCRTHRRGVRSGLPGKRRRH